MVKYQRNCFNTERQSTSCFRATTSNGSTMNQADRIRSFVNSKFFGPAKGTGRSHITIRAGDVHRMMGLNNAFPAVCSVLRGGKLQREANVDFLGQEGPLNGANVFFRFDLSGVDWHADPKPLDRSDPYDAPREPPALTSELLPSFERALVLVSCSKAKLANAAPARDLYCSPAFCMKRAIIERSGASWAILSAKHGLVEPGTVIAPYDLTLTEMGVRARKEWARAIEPSLITRAHGFERVVMFAGQRYSENLIAPLAVHGFSVSEPMRGLRQGEQLAWLAKHR